MKFYLYGHNGSANHGCEAIVRSTVAMLAGEMPVLLSNNPEQDVRYGLDRLIEIAPAGYVRDTEYLLWILYRALFRFGLIDVARKQYGHVGRHGASAYLSIGGDNYCYDRGVETFSKLRSRLARIGATVILWGCSIEPNLLEDESFVRDLGKYHMIFARESITYGALCAKGLRNVALYPDPAFALEELPAPGFSEAKRNALGVNLSPMVQEREVKGGITYANCTHLIRYILERTDLDVLLIPHVVTSDGDDRIPLGRLMDAFRDTGRVSLIPDHGCCALKYVIARCRFFIGARTHATIAAYSSCVPTLALGYSVKARGIARDIFGDEKDYVVPVQTLSSNGDLTRAFQWLQSNERKVRARLERVMPNYIRSAYTGVDALRAEIAGWEART